MFINWRYRLLFTQKFNMDIVICAPSYKRPIVETLRYLPSTQVYVSNDELKEYQEANPKANIIGVDPKFQGNLCRIRNHILDSNKGKAVCIIDDDLKKIGYFEDMSVHIIETEQDFYFFLWKYTQLALDLGVKLWGINVTPDKQNYREYTPFSFTSYIGGPFMVHLDTELRFDERLPLKEDYDFTLQNLNKFRKVLRLNKYFYDVRQAEQTGGCATYRSIDEEMTQFKLLQKKWGSKIVKSDTLDSSRSHKSNKKKNFDINPVLSVPIKGV